MLIFYILLPFIITILLIVFLFVMSQSAEKKEGARIRDWARKNNLNYKRKIKDFFQDGNDCISNIVWGTLNNKRIFLFKFAGIESGEADLLISTFSENHKKTRMGYLFINGHFNKPLFTYDLNQEKIENILNENDRKLQTNISNTGNDTKSERVILTVAKLFLEKNREVSFKNCRKIIESANIFCVKDNFLKGIFGYFWRSGCLKFNPDNKDLVEYIFNKKIINDKELIREILVTYQELIN